MCAQGRGVCKWISVPRRAQGSPQGIVCGQGQAVALAERRVRACVLISGLVADHVAQPELDVSTALERGTSDMLAQRECGCSPGIPLRFVC